MRHRQAYRHLFTSALVLSLAGMLPAEERPADKGNAAVLARRVGSGGLLVFRAAEGKDWTVVMDKAQLAGGGLLVGGGGAQLETINGSARITLTGDLNRHSPFPIIETAIGLLPDAKDGVDLDFTLDRGRVDVTNLKTKGSTKVRMHLRDKTGEFTLVGPGASVSIEVYGRWPKGVPFSRTPKPGEGPAHAIAFIVLKGTVYLNTPTQAFVMEAPPGRALLMGNGLGTIDPTPQHLDKLPAWATDELTEYGKQVAARLQRFRTSPRPRGSAPPSTRSQPRMMLIERRAAVLFMAALDDLPRLRTTLLNTTHADVWDAGVVALRNWIGRGPGQDQRLYQNLIEVCKVPPHEAEIALNLLHSYGDEDLARPETYQFLIGLLNSNRPLLRGLAYWHLSRLVPEGKTIGYDLLSEPEARAKAVARWRELVPPGELPKKPVSKEP